MPAKDTYHEVVKQALVQAGWKITDDPLIIPADNTTNVYIDLGAESLIAAEKETQKIAVEIKSFLGKSFPTELYGAIGQFVAYRAFLALNDPERQLYLAIPQTVYQTYFQRDFAQIAIAPMHLRYLVYDIEQEVITTWQT